MNADEEASVKGRPNESKCSKDGLALTKALRFTDKACFPTSHVDPKNINILESSDDVPHKHLVEVMPRVAVEGHTKNAGSDAGTGKVSILSSHVLPIVLQNGWLDDDIGTLVALDSTCVAARKDWYTKDDGLWKDLTLRTYGADVCASLGLLLQQWSYRSFFANPLVWLEVELQRIRLTEPAWSKKRSFGHPGNCYFYNFRGDGTKTVAHKSKFRYERKGHWFCQNCFRKLSTSIGTREKKKYKKKLPPTTILDFMLAQVRCCRSLDWSPLLRRRHLKLDDIAVVAAYALVQPDCHVRDLRLPKIGPTGHKALAHAIRRNTVTTIHIERLILKS